MFTSRAEYRLMLRQDNADFRLTEKGRDLGLVDDQRWQLFTQKQELVASEQKRFSSTWVQPATPMADLINLLLDSPLAHEYALSDILARPKVTIEDLNEACMKTGKLNELPPQQVSEQVEIRIKYQGYINRQFEEIAKQKAQENTAIPENFSYEAISGLSSEIRQKLVQVRPDTIARATRIPGMTPAAISLLLVSLKKHSYLSRLQDSQAPEDKIA